jgi:hypothetical protein
MSRTYVVGKNAPPGPAYVGGWVPTLYVGEDDQNGTFVLTASTKKALVKESIDDAERVRSRVNGQLGSDLFGIYRREEIPPKEPTHKYTLERARE